MHGFLGTLFPLDHVLAITFRLPELLTMLERPVDDLALGVLESTAIQLVFANVGRPGTLELRRAVVLGAQHDDLLQAVGNTGHAGITGGRVGPLRRVPGDFLLGALVSLSQKNSMARTK